MLTSDPRVLAVIDFVHQNMPHAQVPLYLASAVCALLALAAIAVRCASTGSLPYLNRSWIVHTATWAAALPIFILMMACLIDEDLIEVLKHDRLVVFLAGLSGLVETLKDFRETAGEARIAKNAKVGP